MARMPTDDGWFPMRAAEHAEGDGASAPLPEPDSGPRPFSWHGSGHALLADDEPTVRHVATRALKRLGLEVTACANGREAIEAFRPDPERWRLVVLDLSMPLLPGDEALAELVRIRPAVPAIIYSGYAEADVGHRFAALGNVVFLQKPFTVRALSDAVRAVLGPPDGA
jgi:two-component system, cell cycle sensor histidine kinase and response regulator CckA